MVQGVDLSVARIGPAVRNGHSIGNHASMPRPDLVTRCKRCDAEIVSTSTVRPAGPVTSREPGEVARAPAWWRRVWRRLMPPPSAELILDQLNGQLAVLEGARAEL